MRWLGLTGGIASGKSTVSRILVQAGVPVVDADQVARDVVLPGSIGLQQIVECFGEQVLSSAGALDRKKLGQLVFGQPTQLSQLENILHPLIQQRVVVLRQQLSEQGHALAIYDVPLLFEKKMRAQFEAVILVWCDEQTQIQRMKVRDHFSDSEIALRLQAQLPIESKKSLSQYLIENNSDLAHLQAEVQKFLQEIQFVPKA